MNAHRLDHQAPPPDPDRLRHPYWIWLPAIVFLIGLGSIVLLLVANRINERRLVEADIVDAIMETQSLAATAHLWVEEAVNGDPSIEVKQIFAGLDKALALIDVTLNGGASDYDWIPEPIRDPDQRARAEAIKSTLLEFKRSSLHRLEHPAASGSGSVADQEYDRLFKHFSDQVRDLENLMELEEAKNDAAYGRLFPISLLAWTLIVVSAAGSLFIVEGKRRSIKKGLLQANALLHAQADELAGHRERLEDLVEERTAALLAANERLQAEMAERLQTSQYLHEAEMQNHDLTTRLLSAQETERRRISMELHDELGQALNVIKLQLRIIEKAAPVKGEECDKLLEYVDQVIENLRRISLALSPTVLEDLGITAALQWLVDNLKSDPDLQVTAEVENIDQLFSPRDWITIYRVIQEALTNIVKHAQAGHVSFMTRRQGQRVAFAVEDDGHGFDWELPPTRDCQARGLGLTTMSERVKILGGELELWSRKGRGTRVRFNLPINNEV